MDLGFWFLVFWLLLGLAYAAALTSMGLLGLRRLAKGWIIDGPRTRHFAQCAIMNLTDTDLLDWLELQNAKKLYTGRCVYRWSTTDRGWRLHETSAPGSSTVRGAIVEAILREETAAVFERADREKA